MKKNSSFQLKSGNSLGASAAKLMKQSPARKDSQSMQTTNQFANVDQSKGKPNLKDKLDLGVKNVQNQLESRIKGFFGNLTKGFKTASEKRKTASDQRSMDVQNVKKVVKHELTKPKGTAKPTAGKGGTKAIRERAKKFKFL
jgi:hypothetical protein